jgi:hypothetical protein
LLIEVDGARADRLVIEELRAVLLGGLFGGNEDKATEELARQVVTQAKLMLARRLPAPTEAGEATRREPPDGQHWRTYGRRDILREQGTRKGPRGLTHA